MYLERMNYLEVQEYLKTGDTVIIVTGSTENHGKHMPLGTDTLIPAKITDMIEERIGSSVVIMPALPYGSTEDIRGFAGTVSIGSELLTQVLDKICEQLFDYGFRHFIIMNGHGGNSKPIENTAHRLYRLGARLARIDWWLIAGQINPEWKGGHGGAEEAAGIMGVDETLIKAEYLTEGENMKNDLGDELPSYSWMNVMFKNGQITIPRPIEDITDNGWLAHGMGSDEPTKATPEWGKEMLNAMADYVAEFVPVFAKVPMPERKQ